LGSLYKQTNKQTNKNKLHQNISFSKIKNKPVGSHKLILPEQKDFVEVVSNILKREGD
jgi:hypothetical protein